MLRLLFVYVDFAYILLMLILFAGIFPDKHKSAKEKASSDFPTMCSFLLSSWAVVDGVSPCWWCIAHFDSSFPNVSPFFVLFVPSFVDSGFPPLPFSCSFYRTRFPFDGFEWIYAIIVPCYPKSIGRSVRLCPDALITQINIIIYIGDISSKLICYRFDFCL